MQDSAGHDNIKVTIRQYTPEWGRLKVVCPPGNLEQAEHPETGLVCGKQTSGVESSTADGVLGKRIVSNLLQK